MSWFSRMFRRSSPTPALPAGPVTAADVAQRMKGLTGKQRIDAWQNILTGMSVLGRDKRESADFICEPVSDVEAKELWRGDDIAKRIIEALPIDSMRRGYAIKIEDKDLAEDVSAILEDLSFNRQFVRAKQFARAYGGCAMFPLINDSGDLADPLDESKVTLPRSFQIFEPRELKPETWYEDVMDPKFGHPETWRVVPMGRRTQQLAASGVIIHESRLIIWNGIRVSREQPSGCPEGFGDNVLTPCKRVLRDYNLSWDAALILLQELSQGVFKMSGLAQLIADNEDAVVMRRLLQLDIGKSILKSMVMDKDDDFVRVATQITGLPDVLQQYLSRMAAAADMPVTKLMGISPAGLNATGESDITMWDDRCIGSQDEDMPQLSRGIQLVLLANDGPAKGKEPDVWSAEYHPLRQPSAKEEAERRYIVAQTDQIYEAMGAASGDDIAESRWGGDTYSADMVIDWKAREEQKNIEPEPVDQLALAAMGRAPNGQPLNGNGKALDVASIAEAKRLAREKAAANGD